MDNTLQQRLQSNSFWRKRRREENDLINSTSTASQCSSYHNFLILGRRAKFVIVLEVQRKRSWSLCGCVWFKCVNVTCQSRVGKDTHSGKHTCRHTHTLTLTFKEIYIRFHHRPLQHCAPIPVSSLQSNLPGPRTQSQIPSEAFPFKHVWWNVPISTTLIQNCTSLQRKELKWTLKNDTSQKFDLSSRCTEVCSIAPEKLSAVSGCWRNRCHFLQWRSTEKMHVRQ